MRCREHGGVRREGARGECRQRMRLKVTDNKIYCGSNVCKEVKGLGDCGYKKLGKNAESW